MNEKPNKARQDNQPPCFQTIVRLPLRWWIIWSLVTLLAAATPYLHYRWRVAEIIEPLRQPWGLLPAHWLIFRHFGELAGYLLIAVIAAGFGAWYRPSTGKALILTSSVVTLFFTVVYASYLGLLVTGFIASETREIEAERAAHALQPSPSPTNLP